jgi:hypothetical protein
VWTTATSSDESPAATAEVWTTATSAHASAGATAEAAACHATSADPTVRHATSATQGSGVSRNR